MGVKNECSDWLFDFTIIGEPASKANSRVWRGPGRLIKSPKAVAYAQAFSWQCPAIDPLITEDVAVEVTIWYASRRPDLDPSLILDGLQNKIIKNDRQVKELHCYHELDTKNPRARIRIRKHPPPP